MFSSQSKYLVLIGFIAVMVLMVSVVLVGYKQMSDINRSMELIVNKYNAKTAHITTMHAAARERSISLLRMLDMDDPFVRDEEYINFNAQATKFAVARIALSKLAFDEQEAAYSTEQYALTQASVPILEEVVDLLSNDKEEAAKRLLLDKAIPAQDLVLEQLSSMLEYQDQAAKRSLDAANISYRNTVIKIGLLAIGALVIGLSIAIFVIRYASRANDALFAQVTLKSIGDAVITTNAAGHINYLNPPAEEMTGYTFESAKGKNIIDVFYLTGDAGSRNYNYYIQEAIHNEEPLTVNHAKLKNINDERIAVDFSVTPILDRNDNRIGTALTFRNMSQEHKLRNQLSYQASHDALTGLINRYEFEKRLEDLINSSHEKGSVNSKPHYPGTALKASTCAWPLATDTPSGKRLCTSFCHCSGIPYFPQ